MMGLLMIIGVYHQLADGSTKLRGRRDPDVRLGGTVINNTDSWEMSVPFSSLTH